MRTRSFPRRCQNIDVITIAISGCKPEKSRDTDHLVAIRTPLRSYQQTSPHSAYRETSRDSLTVADELEVRRLRYLVVGLSVEDNALTLTEHEDNEELLTFGTTFL